MTLRHIAARTAQVAILASGILGFFLFFARQAQATTMTPSANTTVPSSPARAHVPPATPKATRGSAGAVGKSVTRVSATRAEKAQGHRLLSGRRLGARKPHHRRFRTTRGAAPGHAHARPGLAKKTAAERGTAGPPRHGVPSISVISPHIHGIRGVATSPKPPLPPPAQGGISRCLNHGGGTTGSTRDDGSGGNSALASPDAAEPARLPPALSQLIRDVGEKPTWRAYLPEVPPA